MTRIGFQPASPEAPVARTVPPKGGLAGVVGPGVQLDRDPLIGPDAVGFEPVFSDLQPDVGSRRRELPFGEEAQEAILELAAGDACRAALRAEDLF